MFIDPKFQFLEKKLVSTTINTTGARDHVPEVKRQIKFTKERMQAHHANLTFPSFTKKMSIELYKNIVMFLNAA